MLGMNMKKGSGCPFKNFKNMMPKNMPEMAKNFMAMMKEKCHPKKTNEPKSVDHMTFDEQLAHAMKLSMEDAKPKKTEEAPKKV